MKTKNNFFSNILLLTDSYKVTHWKQYPKGTTKVYSYFESRGGVFEKTLFFGLQSLIMEYLEGQVVTQEKIDDAEQLFATHFGNENLFNKKGWTYILKELDGYLPVRIKAVPEGTIVPTLNVLMTIENTDKNCHWLTNYLETLLVQVWYPTTVATMSMKCKERIMEYLEETGTPEDVNFKLHDFGCRGASSMFSAGIGGAAHAVNFFGSDTIPAIPFIRHYYHKGDANTFEMPLFSIPATEHSTMTAHGKENEAEAYLQTLKAYPKGLVSIVADSWNIFNAVDNIFGKQLKEEILNRDGVTIIRPDSGEPAPTMLAVLRGLEKNFEITMNDKKYKVLPPQIRTIWGDGIDYKDLTKILYYLKANKWSADNIAFGMGGGLLQKLDRDTQKFAFKCSYIEVNGKGRDVYKQPITDSGKNSKRGRLILTKDGGKYHTLNERDIKEDAIDLLETVFENGELKKFQTFKEIRECAKQN